MQLQMLSPENQRCFHLQRFQADWKSHLLVEYSKNKFACEVMDRSVQDDRYKVVDDIIYYKDRIYLVPNLH
jgi:hypothetical protein